MTSRKKVVIVGADGVQARTFIGLLADHQGVANQLMK